LLLGAFLLVNGPNCYPSLVLASVVQGDAVNCNTGLLTQCMKFRSWSRIDHEGTR